MTTNKEIIDELRAFQKQYDYDMRGDKDLTNGNKGVIGEIRAIKDDLEHVKTDIKRNPSIRKMMRDEPGKTALKGFGGGLFLWVLYDTLTVLDLTKWLAGLIGIELP